MFQLIAAYTYYPTQRYRPTAHNARGGFVACTFILKTYKVQRSVDEETSPMEITRLMRALQWVSDQYHRQVDRSTLPQGSPVARLEQTNPQTQGSRRPDEVNDGAPDFMPKTHGDGPASAYADVGDDKKLHPVGPFK